MTELQGPTGSSMTPADGFRWASAPWGPILTLTAWSPQFRHFFTTRHLRFRGREEARDWARVADELGVGRERLLRSRQVHGTSIAIKRRGDETGGWGAGRPRADIILTDDPTVAVAVQVADCVPVLIADWRTGVVAAVHAGWRGTAKRVVQVAVRALGETFRSHFLTGHLIFYGLFMMVAIRYMPEGIWGRLRLMVANRRG